MPKRPFSGGDAFSAYFKEAMASPPNLSDSMDRLLETFLGFSDTNSRVSFELSLERLVHSSDSESEKNQLIERAMWLGSRLLEAAKRSERKLASKHNSSAWPLPLDLTIKVFSKLDTPSLCHAAAACSMFNKCAFDSLCYADIDLIAVMPKINNMVVCTMIHRAGKNLRSLKLGILPSPSPSPSGSTELARPVPYSMRDPLDASVPSWNEKKSRQGKESSVLTRSCLLPLSMDDGAVGALLKRLHLYNIEKMDDTALWTALSACQSLLDLEVVGLHVDLRLTLEAVSANCHYIERLFLESSEYGREDSLKSPTCVNLVNGCPHLTSLALRGFKLHDHKVRILVKGFRQLKLVDFSTSYSITGAFLRNLGGGTNGNLLEALILRDCLHLKEVEVGRFLSAVLAGDFKLLRYLDISNKDGLSADVDWNERCYSPSNIPISRVLEERPEICLVAEFPSAGSYNEILSSLSFDSSLMSSSETSYNSDQGYGHDENQDSAFAAHGESSDEVGFHFGW